ncbi:RpiB/LacA/LacB family sugar-phosphate isomerase [Patescibacteria group bacterium]|nr:RpiB/LacA/LacB family sugar-phosphate isomerase [Patescibacteria group bacterium]
MKIFLGADHRGFKLKEAVKTWLEEQKEKVVDLGNNHLDPNDDFVDFGAKVAEKVSAGEGMGIVVCGSGGMAMVANKFKGVRAVEAWNEAAARHAREHDDANILMLPADFVDEAGAKTIVTAWLKTQTLVDDKHQRRLNKLKQIEERNFV